LKALKGAPNLEVLEEKGEAAPVVGRFMPEVSLIVAACSLGQKTGKVTDGSFGLSNEGLRGALRRKRPLRPSGT